MKKRPAGRNRQIRGLEGLRTLALFGVLLFHMFPRTVTGGFFGVIMFFAISGFLTAYSSIGRKDVPILTYYRKRIARIYPSLVIMLFVTIEIVALIDHFKLQNTQEEVLSVLLAYNNYWQISSRADYFANLTANSPFTHLWYIAILIQYEILWPLLYRLLRRTGWKLKGLLILTGVSLLIMPAGALLGTVSITTLYYGTLSRIHALLIGACAGWFTADNRGRKKLRVKATVANVSLLLFVVGTIWLYQHADGSAAWVYQYGIVLYALICGLMLVLLSSSKSRLVNLLDNPFTHFMNTYSYEIYLWQYPVLFVFGLLSWNTAFLQYLAQVIILLMISIWNHEFIAFLKQRISG